jgi:hypothetical protein
MAVARFLPVVLLALLVGGCGQIGHDLPGKSAAGNSLVAKRSFHILRGATESLPLAIRSHLADQLAQPEASQFRPTLVQRAHTSEGTAWVFLERDSLCIAQGHLGGVACAQVARAVKDGVSLGVFAAPTKLQKHPHDFHLIGLAPDGITHIHVTIGPHRQLIAVRDNVFVASADRPIFIRELQTGHS